MRGPAAAALLLLVMGCGYRVAGPAPGNASPRLLWIAPMDDRGGEPLFGATLARALARGAVDRADLRLAPRDDAALRLSVRTDRVTESAAAFSAAGLQEYRIAAEVTATLSRVDGTVLWRGTVRADREFAAGSTVEATEQAKAAALELLARDLAGEILRRIPLAAREADG